MVTTGGSQSHFADFLSKYNHALNNLADSDLDAQSESVLETLRLNSKPIGILGVGASFILSQKVAHHFRSFGLPAYSFQIDDILHGDLGLVEPDSVVFIISKSGRSFVDSIILKSLRGRGCSVFLVTENRSLAEQLESKSEKIDTIVLPTSVETDKFQISPSTSIVQFLVFFDFLLTELVELLGISVADFKENHPSGNLAVFLESPISEFLVSLAKPIQLVDDLNLEEVELALEKTQRGLLAIVDGSNILVGAISEGDIRRLRLRSSGHEMPPWRDSVSSNPRVIRLEENVALAWDKLRMEPQVSCLIVVDSSNSYLGLVHARDLHP